MSSPSADSLPCSVFTNNFLGCEELATNENKFLAEDKKLECGECLNGKEELARA